MNRAIYIARAVADSVLTEFKALSKNTKTYVVYGILYDIMINFYKPYAPKLAERLGGTELHISLVTSLPGLFAVLALIPFSVLLAGKKDKRKTTALFFLISRAFLPLLALTPLLPDKNRALVFVIVLSAMNFPDSVSQASLQSYLGDLFWPRQRAEAITIRNKFGNLATTTALTVSCIILNFAVKTNEQKILVYQIFFIISFFVGIAEILVFLRLKNDRKVTQEPQPFDVKSLPQIMRDKKFMTFCLLLFAFHFSYFMGLPLSNIILIKMLNASELWVGVSSIAGIVSIVVSSTFWGRLIAKKGMGAGLGIASMGLAVNCLFMAIAPNAPLYTLSSLFAGWFTCGINLGVLNGLLEATPDKDRVVYVGVFQTFVNLTLAIAPLFAHFVNKYTNIYIALGITSFLRLSIGIIIFFTYRGKQAAKQA